MAGLIAGLIIWAYVLIGVVIVGFVTLVSKLVLDAWKMPLVIAAIAWYGGAPIVWALWAEAGEREHRAQIRHNLEEYAKICAQDAGEAVIETRTNVKIIWVVSESRALYEIFGPNHSSRLFGSGKYLASTTPNEAEYFVSLSTSHHVPYVGTYAVYGGEIRIVERRTGRTIAHRRDYTRGDPMYGRPRNCAGENWRDANLRFVHKVLALPQAENAAVK